MTRLEFNNLSKNKRSDIVWDWGYIISDRKTDSEKIVLFSISSFFVEIAFSLTDEHLTRITGLDKSELHPDYLINISDDNPFFREATFLVKPSIAIQNESISA